MDSTQGSERGKDMTAAAPAVWSWADDKVFEDALVKFPEGVAHRWEMIAGCLPGKTVFDVMVHYDILVYDVGLIKAGLVELPSCQELTQTGGSSGSPPLPPTAGDKRKECEGKKGKKKECEGKKGKKKECERKKGKPWTLEEHVLFIIGLEKYGRGDWRSISRNIVTTRQPSQVASHAQKFFNRHKQSTKDRKRSSIHDITKHNLDSNAAMASLTGFNTANAGMDRLTSIPNANAAMASNAGMDCLTAIKNANAAMDSNAGMDSLTGFNSANAGMDCLTAISNANAAMDSNVGMHSLTGFNSAGMDRLTSMNNANAAMDSNAGMDSLTGFNTNAAMDCLTAIKNANAAMGCCTNNMDYYIDNGTMSVGVDSYFNNNNTHMTAGVDSYFNNNNTHMTVGVDDYLYNNNTHMTPGMDCYNDSMSALSYLSLPESSNTTTATSVYAPANADFQTDEMFSGVPYSEMDFIFQPAPDRHM